MKVVNKKKHKPTPADVYIGRGSGRCHMMNTQPGKYGWLGNPVTVGKKCPECGQVHRDGGSTLDCYLKMLKRRYKDSSVFRRKFNALKGTDAILVCWCKPNPCHGDILVKILS